MSSKQNRVFVEDNDIDTDTTAVGSGEVSEEEQPPIEPESDQGQTAA